MLYVRHSKCLNILSRPMFPKPCELSSPCPYLLQEIGQKPGDIDQGHTGRGEARI